jgi:hypothetical protein
LAALALSLAALAGLALGVSRSVAPPKDPGGDSSLLAAAPNATMAKALPDSPVLDEAQVRSLARQEAEAVLARSRPKKPADDTADSSDSTDTPESASTGAVSASGAVATPPARPVTPKPSTPKGPGATTPVTPAQIPF